MDLKDIVATLGKLPEAEREAMEKEVGRATSDMRWVPNPGPQTEAYFHPADEIFYGGQAGGGKLLRLTEKLPTPSGWLTIGTVRAGDTLFDDQGHPCTVTAVSPTQRPKTYKLTFDDGSSVVAGEEHLWLTYDAKDLADLLTKTDEWRARRRANRPSKAKGNKSAKFVEAIAARNAARAGGQTPHPTGSVRNTQEIVDTLRTPRGRANHAIPVAGALELPDADLPLDPYVLGAWLGGGSKGGGGFTGIDPEIWQRIEAAGFFVTHAAEAKAHYIRDLIPSLRACEVLNDKRIPSEYLRGSKAQRLALLQGLMDTDGHAALDGGCEFDNTNRAIIDGVYELVTSLGIKASVTEGVAKLDGRVIGPKWRVKFVATEPVFYLPRKAARMRGQIRQTARFRYIVAAEELPPEDMRCIAVDSSSRLYLCGRQMVPTHNTDLGIGLALTAHRNSLLLRRTNKEANGLVERMTQLLGSRDGWSSQVGIWRVMDRNLEISGCQLEDDKQKFKGNPHDLYFFDEGSDFSESQYVFITGWNRTTIKGQRCRIVMAGNPPTRPEGLWVIKRWAAWLDPNHPNPAKPGEIRWYTMGPDEREIEVNGPGPHMVGGEMVTARSRTFIPAELSDNPDLVDTNYGSVLDGLPAELRAAYRDGRFDLGLKDRDFQTIPTAWVRAAQLRWTAKPPDSAPMCAMGVDVSGGGTDPMEIARRHDGWYDKIIEVPGREIPMERAGAHCAGLIISHRRDSARVIVDLGGGYGGSTYEQLKANNIDVVGYIGSGEGVGRSREGGFGFYNRRSAAIWKFREALDPGQPGGSPVMLPDDPTVVADLTAPTYEIVGRKVKVESKLDVKKRLGRSTDRGDAVIMAWTSGLKTANVPGGFKEFQHKMPTVIRRAPKRNAI